MGSARYVRRAAAALVALLAGLAMAAPVVPARPIEERALVAPPTTYADLSHEQVLASRGQGAPRPAGSGDRIEWAAGAIGAGALLVFAIRRRARPDATRRP